MGKRRSKGGRPSKPGLRTPSGRLSRAGKPKTVAPNERVLEARESFKSFKGGRSAESYDPIGRAWLVGLLDGHSISPDRMRDAGRSYGDDYWAYYGKTGVAMADLEPEARGSGARKALDSDFIAPDPQGEWLERTDKLLCRAGAHVRAALHNVVIDQFFFPTKDPAWLERLINGRRAAERQRLVDGGRLTPDAPPIAGPLPTAMDEVKLANLITALRILLTGRIAVLASPEEPESAPAPAPPPPPLPPIDPEFLESCDVPDENRRKGHMRPREEIARIILERHAAGQAAQGE